MNRDVAISLMFTLLTTVHAAVAVGVVTPSRWLSAATAVVATAIIVCSVQAALSKLRVETAARSEVEAIERKTGRDPRWRVN